MWKFLQWLAKPLPASVVAFLACFIVVGTLMGPPACRDGWHSRSIGRQGACSWHGGVDRAAGSFRFFGSAAAAGVVWWLMNLRDEKIGERHQPSHQKPAANPPPVAINRRAPACPKCGSPMRERLARRGRRAGRAFWGCSRYPSCGGTLSKSAETWMRE